MRSYQRLLSPLLGPGCRFYPSCSEYAISVIQRQGAARGGLRALGRLLRCTPFQRGGLDLP
jgi:putative membrane protein insertion efficiency factor